MIHTNGTVASHRIKNCSLQRQEHIYSKLAIPEKKRELVHEHRKVAVNRHVSRHQEDTIWIGQL